jgi:hypothetical protein
LSFKGSEKFNSEPVLFPEAFQNVSGTLLSCPDLPFYQVPGRTVL